LIEDCVQDYVRALNKKKTTDPNDTSENQDKITVAQIFEKRS